VQDVCKIHFIKKITLPDIIHKQMVW